MMKDPKLPKRSLKNHSPVDPARTVRKPPAPKPRDKHPRTEVPSPSRQASVPPASGVAAWSNLPSALDATLPDSTPISGEELSPKEKFLNWLKPTRWQFWVILTVLLPGGVGGLALAMLLRLPALPNCPSIFWPTASASLRLYCAELAANKQTVKDLLEAIELVNALPEDHPLRPQINQLIEQWASDILDLGDKVFHQGKLQEAISIARQVPAQTSAASLVTERIDRWQAVWKKAEGLYREAEDFLRKEEWNQAFRTATFLLSVGNNYWETTKYQELTEAIKTAREDGEKLYQARRLVEQGGVDNLVEAIALVEKIGPNSYVYKKAQDEIRKIGRQMLALAEEELEQRRNSSAAINIARRIPASAKLAEEAQDLIILAEAYADAWQGKVASLEAAIIRAQKVTVKRPLYGKAQRLIARWQREIEDIAHLEKAQTLARGGSIDALSNAVAEASLIPVSNPRYEEAQDSINEWQRQIETLEDSPYLNRAEALAIAGDLGSLQAAIAEASRVGRGRALYSEAQQRVGQWQRQVETMQDRPYLDSAQQWALIGDAVSLQAAIDEASRIGPGRALYDEAQNRISEWRSRLQRMQDRPTLDGARDLAARGDLQGAISLAERIGSGRALSNDAADDLQRWRSQIRAEENLQEARRLAGGATPEALAAAIRTADRVPNFSPLRNEADLAISQWSQQILSLAQQQATFDVAGAIEIARRIPENTASYGAARAQIEAWQRMLMPSPTPRTFP
ncbi:chromosome segregation ATPase [Desertifilum sp. FACHB-1129]|nr:MULTISPECIES: chromosome segregation ATPase [Desertifilum]MBD2313654.1 chromosome segregation ATPase [Desertifilum sp. FACHB-1129]MBD2324832.1 chromosome segregation ATPase [Desertifilum sp. FACHB-866]MBD2334920.1 chromosome segregation ATPase [Desertifilum sp. FACHB-868]MDA0213024.1 chromosome segregation ATPase [Cyanobacteria bacterium FC1]